jgi:hypothetical protein
MTEVSRKARDRDDALAWQEGVSLGLYEEEALMYMNLLPARLDSHRPAAVSKRCAQTLSGRFWDTMTSFGDCAADETTFLYIPLFTIHSGGI